MKTAEARFSTKATAHKVIQAFTDPQHLQKWWAVERSLIDKNVGGLYCLAWAISDKGFGFISSGVIQEYQPDSLLVIGQLAYFNPEKPILGPMQLRLEAREIEGITQVHICQSGFQEGPEWDWYYEAVKNGWTGVGEILKAYLEQEAS